MTLLRLKMPKRASMAGVLCCCYCVMLLYVTDINHLVGDTNQCGLLWIYIKFQELVPILFYANMQRNTKCWLG